MRAVTNFKEGYILSVQTASLFILFYAPNKHLVPFSTMGTRFNVQLYFSISTIFIFLVGLYENCTHYLLKVNVIWICMFLFLKSNESDYERLYITEFHNSFEIYSYPNQGLLFDVCHICMKYFWISSFWKSIAL